VFVARDKQASNESKLNKSKHELRVLRDLASQALDKAWPTLPASLNVNRSMTLGKAAAAEAMAMVEYYGEKITALCVGLKTQESKLSKSASRYNPGVHMATREVPFHLHVCKRG
jgi:hypothetical protein